MFSRWLGDDQTIDLKKWAMCLGLRKAYLDTLPNRRWAGHLIVLDDQRQPQELLRLTLDDGRIRLRFLPPTMLNLVGVPTGDLVTLATQIARASPPDPPVLFTLVMDRQAVNEMLIAIMSDPARAKIFGARLAAGYGTHWAVHALTPIGQELMQRIVQNDLWTRLARWGRPSEGQTLIFHRDHTPTMRRGVRLADGQVELLEPAELINVSDAIWVDERFIGEGIEVLDQLLREPPKNLLTLYGHVFSLLRRNYIRRPGDKTVSWLQFLPDMLKGIWQQSAREMSVPPVPQSEKLALALYFQFGALREQDEDILAFEQRCSALLDVLDRHPNARVAIGWTETALHILSVHCAGLERRYLSGVQDGRFETISVIDTPPFPMLISRQLLRVQADNWETAAARQAQLWARGVVCLGENLSPGWGEALGGHNYQYIALGEETLRRVCPGFDPTRPIVIEGWPAVGFYREASQVLPHIDDLVTLNDYLRYLAASFANQALAIRIDLGRVFDLDWLEPFLQIVEGEQYDLIFLSELADAQAQGSIDIAPDLNGVERWAGTETARALNSAFSTVWDYWQDLNALADCIQADEQERVFDLDIQRISLDIQKCRQGRCALAEEGQDESAEIEPVNALVERALDQGRALAHNRMLRFGPFSTLPEHALGTLRVFDPLGVDRQNDLLTVSLPLPDSLSPHHVVFMDHGLTLPSQWLGRDPQGLDQFLVVVDVAAGQTKDLIVLREGAISPLEGLDITSGRLCNPTLAVLLDEHGQVTSIRFLGQERLCGPGNQVRGHLLELDQPLRCDLSEADIRITSSGPLRGTVTIRQTWADDIVLVRHLHLSLFSSLLECETELDFAVPLTFAGKFIVGEFNLIGEQVIWPQPLQAGSVSSDVGRCPPVIFSAEDTVELRKAWHGMRYIVHQTASRTFQFAARPVANGLRIGMIASMPTRVPNLKQLDKQSGLGFPGHTYYGHYRYRYALQPVSPDLEMQAVFYNRPLLWSFYPK